MPISSDVLKAVFQVHGIDAADGSFGLVGKSVQQPAAFAQIVQPRTAVHEYIETDQRPVAIPGTPRQCDARLHLMNRGAVRLSVGTWFKQNRRKYEKLSLQGEGVFGSSAPTNRDRTSTRMKSSHYCASRMPSSA